MEPLDSGLHVAGLTEFLAQPTAGAGADLGPGTRLGDVTIVRLVAEGGMGRVYEGLQGMPCRTVAVKVIRPGVLSPAAMRRFEHEAQILGRLTHPGIARIYTLATTSLGGMHLPYFVMEFVEDALSITDYARDRSLGMRDRVSLFRDACRAVAYGHGKGVIHRDLKPGNILVDAAGHAKVIDFGVARTTDVDVARTTMHTDVGQLVGTLQYMSPEQFEGEVDELDVRADVYALGVVLYELLAGRPPYELARRPVYEAARVVREEEPKSLAAVHPMCRGDLATIVAKCMEKDRSRRYTSAAEVEADLGRYLRGESISASPRGLGDGLRRLARRHRLAAAAAAASLVALVVAVVGISLFAVRAERERRVAVAERERADAATRQARQQLYVANVRSLQDCLDDRNLRTARHLHAESARLVDAPVPLELGLLGARLDDATGVLDMGPGSVGEVAFSTDGGLLAVKAYPPQNVLISIIDHPSLSAFSRRYDLAFFAIDDTLLCRREPAGRGWPDVWKATFGDFRGLELPPGMTPLAVDSRGETMTVHAADGTVQVVHRSTGSPQATLEGHRGRLRRAIMSPDGARIAIEGTTAGLGLWDAFTGRLVARCAAGLDVATCQFSPSGARLALMACSAGAPLDIQVYDTVDGRVMATVPGAVAGMGQRSPPLVFSADGSRLAAWSQHSDVNVYDPDTGRLLFSLGGHGAAVGAVAFSPDGRQIASGAANGRIRLWDARAGSVDRELLGHDGEITALAFRPDDETLASGAHDGTVRLWSRTASRPLAEVPDVRGLSAVAFSPDGSLLALAAPGSAGVELLDVPSLQRCCILTGLKSDVARLAFSPDGRYVAAACAPHDDTGDVVVWLTRDEQPVARLEGHDGGAVHVAFSPDGTAILTGDARSTARVWDFPSGRERFAHMPRARRRDSCGGVLAAGGTRVVAPLSDVLDATTGAVVHELPPRGLETCLAVSPDGGLIAIGTAIGYVSLFDVATGLQKKLFDGHSGGIQDACFSADVGLMATASLDGTARVWNVATGRETAVCRGHAGHVVAVRFTPDGRRLVTAGADGAVRVWDAVLGQEVCMLEGQRTHPHAVALSPDGTLVAAASDSGRVTVHGLSNAAISAARQRRRETAPVEPAAAPRAPRGTRPGRPDPGA